MVLWVLNLGITFGYYFIDKLFEGPSLEDGDTCE